MDLVQRWQQSQTVGDDPNSLENLKGSNIAWAQLSFYSKPTNTFRRGYFQKHMVTHLELQFPSPDVCITLLPIMCCLNPFPDQLDLLYYLLDHLGSKHLSYACFIPADWRTTPPSVQSLERRHPDTHVVAIVVRKFYQRQMVLPRIL